jgi:hypothetical protein
LRCRPGVCRRSTVGTHSYPDIRDHVSLRVKQGFTLRTEYADVGTVIRISFQPNDVLIDKLLTPQLRRPISHLNMETRNRNGPVCPARGRDPKDAMLVTSHALYCCNAVSNACAIVSPIQPKKVHVVGTLVSVGHDSQQTERLHTCLFR